MRRHIKWPDPFGVTPLGYPFGVGLFKLVGMMYISRIELLRILGRLYLVFPIGSALSCFISNRFINDTATLFVRGNSHSLATVPFWGHHALRVCLIFKTLPEEGRTAMCKRAIVAVVAVWMFLGVVGVNAMGPEPDPDKLWRFITQESAYDSWGFWGDHKGLQPGGAPHGPFHKVYVNERGLKSMKAPVQHGTLIVKENYGDETGKELKAVTVMYKVKGYNPEAGDWFWVKYTPQGVAEKYGRPQGCINCHASLVDNDYIMVHGFGDKDE